MGRSLLILTGNIWEASNFHTGIWHSSSEPALKQGSCNCQANTVPIKSNEPNAQPFSKELHLLLCLCGYKGSCALFNLYFLKLDIHTVKRGYKVTRRKPLTDWLHDAYQERFIYHLSLIWCIYQVVEICMTLSRNNTS